MTMIDISAVDLNILKVFEALYEEGGATRAGVRLGLTQSAVSAALARLRKTYGDQLFTRTGRGLVPTLRAQELKPLISEGLNKCRQSLSMSGSGGNDFHGRSIVVGLSDDFEVAFGRLFIDAVAARAPGLRLAFRQTHSLVVGNMLQRQHAASAARRRRCGVGRPILASAWPRGDWPRPLRVPHGSCVCTVHTGTDLAGVRPQRPLASFLRRLHRRGGRGACGHRATAPSRRLDDALRRASSPSVWQRRHRDDPQTCRLGDRGANGTADVCLSIDNAALCGGSRVANRCAARCSHRRSATRTA